MNRETKMTGFKDLKTDTKSDETTAEKRFRMHQIATFFQNFPEGACPRSPLAWLRTSGAHFRRTNPNYMATPL